MKRKPSRSKATALSVCGYALCILPPAAAVLEHFPVWLAADERSAFSAIGMCLLALCCLPFLRALKAWLRTPSAWRMWLCLFLVLWLGRPLAEGLLAVSFFGVLGSIAGAVLLKMGRAEAERAKAEETAAPSAPEEE